MFSYLKRIFQRPLVRALFSGVVLAILIAHLPLSDLWETIKKISLQVWLLAACAFAAGHVLGALKWRILIDSEESRLPLIETFRCYFAGLFANLFLPSLVGGDIVRAALAIRLKARKEGVIVGSLLDRGIDVGSLVLILFSGTLLFPGGVSATTYRILLTISLLALLSLVGLIILLIVPLGGRLQKWLGGTINYLRETVRTPIKGLPRVMWAAAISLIVQTWFAFLFSLLGAKVHVELALPVWFIVWPTAKLSAMLPLSLGGLGVREAVLAVLLGQFGVTAAKSVGLGLVWESIVFATSGLGGIFYLLSSRELKRLSASSQKRTRPVAEL